MMIKPDTEAIVFDGRLKHSLAMVRSLGRKGITVYCGAESKTAMAAFSRYTSRRFLYPSPLSDQAGFIASLKHVVSKCKKPPVIFAGSDATFLTIYNHREELKDLILFPLTNREAIDIAFDKGATFSEARILGVPVIATYLREQASEFDKIAGELNFPMVVKPRSSASWLNGKGFSETAKFVHSQTQLKEVFNDLKNKCGQAPLVQPFLEGEEYGVEVLAKDGEIVALAAHNRLRSMSPTGGASVLKETCDLDDGLINNMTEHARTLVKALSWQGPMMVEFKVDSDTREPKLMELNGRFWGSLPLAIEAGVDFPYLYYELATGQPLPEQVVKAKSGVITRHWLGDVRHLLRVFLAQDPMRSLLYPERVKAIKDFFNVPKGTRSDVFLWRDPLPSLVEYVDLIKKIWK
jgi:predicted ATP-grasp superfamily ATP-dependent carboligase